jgi:hypothetical protein
MDVFYADFAKAFDKVPHRKLVAKLKSYGTIVSFKQRAESGAGKRVF